MQMELLSNCCSCSSELWGGGAITLEGSVVDLGTVIVHEWHDWLVLRTVPLNESWFSVSVSVHILVVLMVDWHLACHPLTVGIWHWWVLWKHTGHGPVQEIWMVDEGLGVEGMVPEDGWSVVSETTAGSTDDVVDNPAVSESATSVEVFDWQLTDGKESKTNSELGSCCVVSMVEVRFVGWSSNFSQFSFWEP